MIFGIYPGGALGDDQGRVLSGPPDDPAAITKALDELGVTLVRGYRTYTGAADTPSTPDRVEQYVTPGRKLDLVLQYQSPTGDVDGYADWVRAEVARHGADVATLQIAEEPNVVGNPTLDGAYPRVREAIVAGVLAAKDEARARGFADLRVGFNTTVLFGPAAGFVADLTTLGGPEFTAALDYVGLDFFPDVFRPMPLAELAEGTAGLLTYHREQILTPAGIAADIPIHITENGWPTGPARTPEQQAQIVATIVGAVVKAAREVNVAAYTHFSLRDADSGGEGLFWRFGLMDDGYGAKPAFGVFAGLVERYS
ncbi:hypothetical protein [Phytomonospora endophytica]|uniref:Uncharacterized protein n=1 Tax=Phytomonospora endophytica TaxID=714109 RepID=A0A841FBZ7_9ACTN|nr:hypothetical protein [Phytomonospora endophytica]MBB6034811.1 hypothetical protein [Phytomonospora endophytica]GIG68985.1 hypothetical protein Pen01_52800 [Phytomonospora endophytica]